MSKYEIDYTHNDIEELIIYGANIKVEINLSDDDKARIITDNRIVDENERIIVLCQEHKNVIIELPKKLEKQEVIISFTGDAVDINYPHEANLNYAANLYLLGENYEINGIKVGMAYNLCHPISMAPITSQTLKKTKE